MLGNYFWDQTTRGLTLPALGCVVPEATTMSKKGAGIRATGISKRLAQVGKAFDAQGTKIYKTKIMKWVKDAPEPARRICFVSEVSQNS